MFTKCVLPSINKVFIIIIIIIKLMYKFYKNVWLKLQANSVDPALYKKVKVSHSLIAVGAVGGRFPLYLGHS